MVKKTLLASMGAFVLPVFVFAQSSLFSLPPDNIRTQVSDNDWKEAYCLESKAQGGWAIASIQGFAQAIRKPLEDFNQAMAKYDTEDWYDFQDSFVFDFYGSFSGHDYDRWSGELPAQDANYYDGLAETIKMDLNEICQAETPEQTVELINKFVVDFADEPAFATFVGDLFRAEMESWATKMHDNIQSNIDQIIENFQAQYDLGNYQEQEEKRLQEEADQEAEERRSQEYARIAEEVQYEIQQRAQTGEFGVPPNVDYTAIALATDALSVQRMAEAYQRIEAELTEKYALLAQNIEKRLETELRDQLVEESWQTFDIVLKEFDGIEDEARFLADEIYKKDWQQFYVDAHKKKTEIITAAVNTRTEQAKNWILVHRSEIEQSREAIAREGLAMPTIDELVSQLESEKQSLILELSGDPAAFHNVNKLAASLRELWDKARLFTENAEGRTTYQLLFQSLSFVNDSRFMNRLRYEGEFLNDLLDNFSSSAGPIKEECRQMGYDENLHESHWSGYRSPDYYLYSVDFPGQPEMKMIDYFKKYYDDRLLLGNQRDPQAAEEEMERYKKMSWFCPAFLDQNNPINSFSGDMEIAYNAQQNLFNILNEFQNYGPETSAEQLLAYKDRLIEARNDHSAIDTDFEKYRPYFAERREGWRDNGQSLEGMSRMSDGWLMGSGGRCFSIQNTINRNSYSVGLCLSMYQKR